MSAAVSGLACSTRQEEVKLETQQYALIVDNIAGLARERRPRRDMLSLHNVHNTGKCVSRWFYRFWCGWLLTLS